MNAPYQGWVEVDLDALDHNIARLRAMANGAALGAVVKANAYGHGALAIAEASMRAGAERVCTYNLDEASELRTLGFRGPILVLGRIFPGDAARAVQLRVAVTVSESETAAALGREALAHRVRANVHVKIEAGLNRLGLPPDEALPFIDRVRGVEGLTLEGVYTHFPSADGPIDDGSGRSATEQRFERFVGSLLLGERGREDIEDVRIGRQPYQSGIGLLDGQVHGLHRQHRRPAQSIARGIAVLRTPVVVGAAARG